jgi:flagellar biosynthesis/type III secretory pathway M-ring protein FliF/YscJ
VKTILILCAVIVVLLVVVALLFKAWRKNVEKYKAEHERAERLRYQVELAQNEAKIRKEVFEDAEKEKHKTDGLSGRDKFNAITDSLRDND